MQNTVSAVRLYCWGFRPNFGFNCSLNFGLSSRFGLKTLFTVCCISCSVLDSSLQL